MTGSMPMLKSSRANYIFISDNGFLLRDTVISSKNAFSVFLWSDL